MDLKVTSGVIASLLVISGLGWSGHQMYSAKADKHDISELELKVAGSLDERDYQRYEEKIEEIQEERIELMRKQEKEAADHIKIELLKQREKKYEKRQQRYQ